MPNFIDSGDLKELARELDDLREQDDEDGEALDEDERKRMKLLEALEKDLGDLHVASNKGLLLIHEDYFEDYCREIAEESEGAGLSERLFRYIDWERYADDCRSDYSSLEFEGVTYYWMD